MTVLFTDAKYRMTLALAESLGKAGYTLAACQRKGEGAPLAFSSKYVSYAELLEDDSVNSLQSLCQRLSEREGNKIVLLPVGAKTQLSISRNRAAFEPFCHLCIPTAGVLSAVNDKKTVHEAARELNIPVPRDFTRTGGQTTEEFLASLPLPCVIKPPFGEQYGLSAKDRYTIARTPIEARRAYERFARLGDEPVAQEYIPGFGAGVSLVMDNLSRPVSVICHERVLEYPVSGGPSALCRSFYDQTLVDQAVSLLKHFAFTGVAMVEFKGDYEKGFSLLEINPRIWGAFPLVRAAGSDFASRWCRAARGEEMPFTADYKRGVLMKYTFSALAAGLSLCKGGRWGKGMGAFAAVLNPAVQDGVFVLSDPKPGLAYMGSMAKKAFKR